MKLDHIKPVNGYRSTFESVIAKQLEDNGVKFRYEYTTLNYKIDLEDDSYIHSYNPDFTVLSKDGTPILLEVKGYFDTQARSKMIAVKRQHSEQDIRLIFQRGKDKIGSLKTTNLTWAKRVGYPAADKLIPSEWLDEMMTVEEYDIGQYPKPPRKVNCKFN